MKGKLFLMALTAAALIITAHTSSAPARITAFRSAEGVRSGPAKLGTVEQFKTAFQNDMGKVRLVALVSPT